MKYTNRTFTCPASQNTKDIDWDLCFMDDKGFSKKYGVTKDQHKKNLKD